MKNIFLTTSFFFISLSLFAADLSYKVATYDSGFGGFFTAKEIESEGRKLSSSYQLKLTLNHYGDTANAPYGEKTPDRIAELTAKGIERAFSDGAQEVYIACNTASTQYEAIRKILNKKRPGSGEKIISIIESSVQEMRAMIDETLKSKDSVFVAILATPATSRSMTYPNALAKSYGLSKPVLEIKSFTQDRWYKKKGNTIESVLTKNIFNLPGNKKIHLYQIGPANWVDMIEHGAPEKTQLQEVQNDLKILAPKLTFDVVGEFCTHFPVFDGPIKETALKEKLATEKTRFIQQGPLMAKIFKERMAMRLKSLKRSKPLTTQEFEAVVERTRPTITISGPNAKETEHLARTIFPQDPTPTILQQEF